MFEISRSDNKIIELITDNKMQAEQYRGSEEPLLGWYSSNFNNIQKTVTIKTSLDLDVGTILITKGKIL
ncbi:hypothetical protein ACFLUV_03155 [Elusimicrobiota bacterium]